MNFISLGVTDLALASLLIIINGALSLVLGLGLERQLIIAACRMVVQLSLVGIVLKTLFAIVSPFWTAVAALVMVLFAGYEASARQRRKLSGWWTYGIGTSSMMAAGIVVTVLALTTQIKPDPWCDRLTAFRYDPWQYHERHCVRA
jgi:putative ABC transport system permease protein